jgi:hypothetical protein
MAAKLHAVDGGSNPPQTPPDADDFESLWLDPALGDGITDANYHSVAVGKPRDFFRVHPNKDYRRRVEIYTHKSEGAIDEQHFIVAPAMAGKIEEARPCTLVCCLYRDGSPRLWPIKFPKDGEKDNAAWITARAAAKTAIEKWTRLVWVRSAYTTRDALEGFAPDPDWSKLPSFDELARLAFGKNGVIRNTSHDVYCELFGHPKKAAADAGDVL